MRTRLRFLLKERDVRDATDEEVLSVYRDIGVVPKAERDDNFNKTPEDLSNYKLVLPGDVVVNKMKAWQGSIAVSNHKGIVSGDYLVCSVVGAVNRRYLHHLLRSRPMVDEYAIRSKGIRPSQWRMYWDDLADIQINLPSVVTQERIADYLDNETARIDALIDKKRRMVALTTEHLDAFIDRIVWDQVALHGPLMFRTDQSRPIMYGIVLPGPNVADGVPIVKGGDVAGSRLSPELLNRTTPEIEAPFARARLAPDDLVFAIRGGIGDVELVPHGLAGANITQDVARVSCGSDVAPQWLRLVLRSRSVQQQVKARITGATVKGLNIWELKRVFVPMSTRDRQERDLARLLPAERRAEALCSSIPEQVDLLVEHRRALIAAAVTGQLRIPGRAA